MVSETMDGNGSSSVMYGNRTSKVVPIPTNRSEQSLAATTVEESAISHLDPEQMCGEEISGRKSAGEEE
jgi:hypothetical protein